MLAGHIMPDMQCRIQNLCARLPIQLYIQCNRKVWEAVKLMPDMQ